MAFIFLRSKKINADKRFGKKLLGTKQKNKAAAYLFEVLQQPWLKRIFIPVWK